MASCWATGQAFVYAGVKIGWVLPPFSAGPKLSSWVYWLLWSLSHCLSVPPVCQRYFHHGSRVSEGLETKHHGVTAMGMLTEPQKGELGSGRQSEPVSARWALPKQPLSSQTSAGRCPWAKPRAERGVGAGAAGTAGRKGRFCQGCTERSFIPTNPSGQRTKGGRCQAACGAFPWRLAWLSNARKTQEANSDRGCLSFYYKFSMNDQWKSHNGVPRTFYQNFSSI